MSDTKRNRILIIDDNLINRKKMRFCVENLGFEGHTAEDGTSGLKALRGEPFDAVLLDMLMPGMDGFEVLRQLKADELLRHLPVIVVSDLEGDTRSVSSAIEMGAEDFLPKNFDPVILNARLTSGLRRKQFRDQELEYFRRINALTNAAEQVDAGRFDEGSLNLAEEIRINDPIGRLAGVFQGMAGEIHAREMKLLQRIRTLQCCILLLICGGLSGLFPSLSKLAAGMGANPIGMSVWVCLFASVICAVVIMFRGGYPKLSRSDVAFFVVWAFVIGILQQISIFILAGYVQATYLTLVLALEGLVVFAFAALTRLEQTTFLRVLGLLIGLLGVGISLYQRMEGNEVLANYWLLVAFITPAIYAFETIAVAAKRPDHIDPICAVGFMFAFSTAMAAWLAIVSGNLIPPQALYSPLGGLLAAIAFVMVIVNVTFFILLKLGGSVFTSQKAYVSAIAGVLSGMVLLGETMSVLAWVAIGLVLLGMYLVGTKVSEEAITIQRDFGV
jgi:DNA-binding response OmpR family regulator